MPESQPNILLVMTDQQRYDAAGEAGPSFLRTPHFDHISREANSDAHVHSLVSKRLKEMGRSDIGVFLGYQDEVGGSIDV